MAKKSRDKGSRIERELYHKLKDRGFDTARVDAKNNQLGIDDSHDLVVEGKTVEVKARAAGFKQLYHWLDPVDVLVVKADRQSFLVVQRLEDWAP
tara:strand:- start:346 stop:630 length:285 start_codon:yes stop_codon:yes gene_type:complete